MNRVDRVHGEGHRMGSGTVSVIPAETGIQKQSLCVCRQASDSETEIAGKIDSRFHGNDKLTLRSVGSCPPKAGGVT